MSKKRAKTFAPNKTPDKTTKRYLEIFQRHYGDLVTAIQSCPVSIADKLFSRKLVSDEVHGQVITSQYERTHISRMVREIKNRISFAHDKLLEFIEVLEDEPSLENIAKQLKGKS